MSGTRYRDKNKLVGYKRRNHRLEKKYQDIDYKPVLFYVVFGVTVDELVVSQDKHHVDAIPEGLDISSLNREKHGDYMDGFLSEQLENILEKDNLEVFAACKNAENCLVLRGVEIL